LPEFKVNWFFKNVNTTALNIIHNHDVITGLDLLEPKSIHCCVTSPPYFGLRNYNLPPSQWLEITFSMFGFPVTIPAQECCLGMEQTPMAFVAHIVFIFRKVRTALKDDGTLWLNFGDSYNGTGCKTHQTDKSPKQKTSKGAITQGLKILNGIYKPKDLIGIPWMVAFALRDDGWFLRMDNIWNKPNPMPESVTDRPTKSHEYFFLLSKSKKDYYDYKSIQNAY